MMPRQMKIRRPWLLPLNLMTQFIRNLHRRRRRSSPANDLYFRDERNIYQLNFV